ncbi:MAG: choice-of-anchor D domain-containing protein [Candidatus Acidiferrum sp.]
MKLGLETHKVFTFCKLILVLTALLAFQLAAPAAHSQTCISSSGSWSNATLSSAQSATFRVVYDATPSARIMDAVAGLSSSSAHAFTDIAAATHFDPSGVINVRNGSGFSAASRILYSAGVKYHFILDVNVAAHTYTAYIVVGSTQTTLGANAKFRSEQSAVKSLNNVGNLSSQGSLSICNIAVSAAPSSTKLILNPSTTNLNFGKVSVSSSSNQNITLTNAGNSSVTISKVTVSGAGFNASGSVAGLILSPNQTATVRATFAPAAIGTQSGSIVVSSNATNSPANIALSGTGVVAAAHSVALSWSPSSSGTTGYNVYVGSNSGGPYSRLTPTPVTAAAFLDTNVVAGKTYYYVVTALNSANQESAHSTEVKAVVP